MYKIKRFSAATGIAKKGGELADTLMRNAKDQAIKNPLAAVSLGLVGANSALNMYNSKQSKKARRNTVKALRRMKGSNENIIIM